jgi:RPA family protein
MVEQQKYERQTAYITNVATLLSSQFVKGEAQMQPSYVTTKGGMNISRAHIIAVIVATSPDMQAEATLDDGTGKIVARSFEQSTFFAKVALGDIVRVIGKVRSFNEKIYLIPEVLKKVTDKKWVKYHKLHMETSSTVVVARAVPEIGQDIPVVEQENIVVEDPIDADDTQPQSPADDILRIIKEIDTGDGAQIEAVIAQGNKDAEKIIRNLLETGEIFEIRPGRVKVLE